MAFTIEHHLEVDAPAERVWEVITDLARYGEWNPFVRACRSTLKPGDPLEMEVKLGNSVRQEEEIMHSYDEGVGFAYCMDPPPLGALASYRSHRIEPVDANRCRYHSRFELTGWLAPVVKAFVGAKLQDGFTGMSYGIRDRAEELAQMNQNAQTGDA